MSLRPFIFGILTTALLLVSCQSKVKEKKVPANPKAAGYLKGKGKLRDKSQTTNLPQQNLLLEVQNLVNLVRQKGTIKSSKEDYSSLDFATDINTQILTQIQNGNGANSGTIELPNRAGVKCTTLDFFVVENKSEGSNEVKYFIKGCLTNGDMIEFLRVEQNSSYMALELAEKVSGMWAQQMNKIGEAWDSTNNKNNEVIKGEADKAKGEVDKFADLARQKCIKLIENQSLECTNLDIVSSKERIFITKLEINKNPTQDQKYLQIDGNIRSLEGKNCRLQVFASKGEGFQVSCKEEPLQ